MTIFLKTDFASYLTPNFETFGNTCAGAGGYDDLVRGAEITVTASDGKVIATGELGSGHPENLRCTFHFTIKNVPRANIYGIEITQRGIIRYTQKQIDENDVALTIGH